MIKKVILLLFIAVALMVFVQCKEKTKTSLPKHKETIMDRKQKNLVGGWKSIEVTDTVKELADYVISENNIKSPINKVFNAASQVVSGKNYKFEILLENGEVWKAQVYLNIKKERSITSFKLINNT
ncbi:hypothetical protein BTO05_13375 [Winogradskyella sp. PC-19]|uniref:cystatin family protein n=1 Tax=unclassified Winogradskyella TaxID=2615021 RepID=UPI000B3C6D1C|nr:MULTISPECIES: cystatin domain-containing protein [unclassified Winogradskyella]ARV10576.1 hypothetical protein BTO05_13375 [Winogradskyella sp. PC-19]